MRSLLFFFVLGISVQQLQAQAKRMDGHSGAPRVINFSDPSIQDYEINLMAIDQHPIPSAEYGNLKQQLQIQRLAHQEQYGKTSSSLKTRGLAPNPNIVKSVQGNTASSVPNDNDIAVSNDGKVISVVNANLRIYDDTLKTILNKSLTSLVSTIGVYTWLSDPRVIYDPASDRFVLVCFSGNVSATSTILVGFTQTNDPGGNWNFYTLNGNSFNDSTWSDYPIISVSDKDLFITFNQVKDSVSWTIGFKQSVIWQIDKQGGYAGTPLQYHLWSDIKYNGTPLRNICPAKNQSASMGNSMYFLTLRNVATSNDSIFVTEITDSYQSGNASLQQKVLISPVAYGFPPNAVQKYFASSGQQYLMTNDARVLAAIYENDRIHFGANTVNPAHANAGVYLGEIRDVSTTSPTVKADIFSNDTVEYGYPSMAWMGNNNSEHKVMYTFSHCYVDSFPGTSILYKDNNGNYSDVIPVKNGVSYINVLTDSTERWGDYTNIQKKYNTTDRAYLSGSWGKASGMNCWVAMVDNTDFTVGVSDIVNQEEDILYPNPVTDRVNVRFSLETGGKTRFEIMDMQGRVVRLLLDTYTKAGRNDFSFCTQPLLPGNYVLRISGAKGIISTQAFTVQ
ncbi:MAG: hypothetical protein RIQ62_3 [Bacteroidota bacterium]